MLITILCHVHACFSHFFCVECIMTFASKTVMAHSVTDASCMTNFYFLLQNYWETSTSLWIFYFTSFYASVLCCRWRRDSGVRNVSPNCPVPTSAVRLQIVLQWIVRESRNLTHSQHWRVKSQYGVDILTKHFRLFVQNFNYINTFRVTWTVTLQ